MVGVTAPSTGWATFRDVDCKDCVREGAGDDVRFEYSEAWAIRVLDRGGTRSDRCARHRREHHENIQAVAVAYIDIETLGEVRNGENPSGPLGGLGPLPGEHRLRKEQVDLGRYGFGMHDNHVRKALRKLADRPVLVLRAGTGTGKSTFFPYRLLNPPASEPGDAQLLRVSDNGPIIVTEPRKQATTGVAQFVGERLVAGCPWSVCSVHGRFVDVDDLDPDESEHLPHPGPMTPECSVTMCSSHIGPGFPVGYQVKDDRRQDESCALIYATDGTVVNWLTGGRLSRIGAVVVDEAHERNSNIDFIMGELHRQLVLHPHLKVVITSATFNIDFYTDYFGADRVHTMDVPPVKSFGYGSPLFPDGAQGATVPACPCPRHDPARGPDQSHPDGDPTDFESWLAVHWREQFGPDVDGRQIDLHALTQDLYELRYRGPVPESRDAWRREMPEIMNTYLVELVRGLDAKGVPGDVLAFLPNQRLIDGAVDAVSAKLDLEQVDVLPLLSSMPQDIRTEALAARPPGAKRKVVVATNIAETSLTVKGVRFVVDSGLISQSAWDPVAASKTVPTGPHSQAGMRQRWGRVGRSAPGWVFPLYPVEEFDSLAEDTPPGSTRDNLERLVLTAKAAGVEDLDEFPWPALHAFDGLDESARCSSEDFAREFSRARAALGANGVIDADGYLTAFGAEIQRFASTGADPGTGLAVMVADQLACVPETAATLALFEAGSLLGANGLLLHDSDATWPVVLSGRLRQRALIDGCEDDLDIVLRIAAMWDAADRSAPFWEATPPRRFLCRRWWLNEKMLAGAAQKRREILAGLSPIMNEEVKRFVDPGLGGRVRAALSHALVDRRYSKAEGWTYVPAVATEPFVARVNSNRLLTTAPDTVLAFQRRRVTGKSETTIELDQLVTHLEWAVGVESPLALVRGARDHAPYNPDLLRRAECLAAAPAPGTVVYGDGNIVEQPPIHLVGSIEAAIDRTANDDNRWLMGPGDEGPSEYTDPDEEGGRPLSPEGDPGDPESSIEANDADDGDVDLTEIIVPAPGHPVVTTDSAGDAIVIGLELDDSCAVRPLTAPSLVAAKLQISDGHFRVRRRLAELESTLLGSEMASTAVLVLAASPGAIGEAVRVLSGGQVTATMVMSQPKKVGVLFGRGGSTIQEMVKSSGVHGADFDNNRSWSLVASEQAALERFVTEANARVNGNELVVDSGAIPVKDLVTDRSADPSGPFDRISPAGWIRICQGAPGAEREYDQGENEISTPAGDRASDRFDRMAEDLHKRFRAKKAQADRRAGRGEAGEERRRGLRALEEAAPSMMDKLRSRAAARQKGPSTSRPAMSASHDNAHPAEGQFDALKERKRARDSTAHMPGRIAARDDTVADESVLIPKRFSDAVEFHVLANFGQVDGWPLVLGVHGPPGEGKTFQIQGTLRRLGVEFRSLGGGDLESEDAGAPARLIRESYVELSRTVQGGLPACLVFNDIDTGGGEWEGNTGTVNHQTVLGELMNLVDDPYLVGGVRTRRLPVIMTGNDFTKLYAPLRRPGRMHLFEWIPSVDERFDILRGMFQGVSDTTVSDLARREHLPISFFAQVLAQLRIDALRGQYPDLASRRAAVQELARTGTALRLPDHESDTSLLGAVEALAATVDIASHLGAPEVQ